VCPECEVYDKACDQKFDNCGPRNWCLFHEHADRDEEESVSRIAGKILAALENLRSLMKTVHCTMSLNYDWSIGVGHVLD
jgi:hypothetical protein